MSDRGVIEEVQHRASLKDWTDAERITTHVLHALRPLLRDDERRAFAVRLPSVLGDPLRGPSPQIDDDVSQFFERVAHGTHERLGMAVEHARIVCAVLGEQLPLDTRARLMRDLPAPIAALFAPSNAGPPVVTHEPLPVPAREGTLATGRPGSRHPVSEAPEPDRTQTHSVARQANPHGDRKVSSAEGLTQEQLRETLATGRPSR